MTSALEHRRHPPHPALRGWVECLWTLKGRAGAAAPEPVLPDGRMEVVLHRGDPFARLAGEGKAELQPRALVAGQLDRALLLRPGAVVDVVGIRFTPAGAAAFIEEPLRRLAGETPELAAIAGALGRELENEVLAAEGADDPVRRAGQVLLRRAGRLPAGPSRDPVSGCVEEILARRGQVGMGRLADLAGWSLRHLERRFADRVGLDPRSFARIIRFRSIFEALARDPAAPWVSIALDCGYCDQSHMIREFRRFAGTTPPAWVASGHRLAGLFLQPS
ncbi:MAG TPA: helix-turn-helix domain-containing protein [Candidatus Polarisedimenticolia bacterium]|nr:helix-turn-helix domain-containing protein [Candidatus Polarisedimenticolia bacterium]